MNKRKIVYLQHKKREQQNHKRDMQIKIISILALIIFIGVILFYNNGYMIEIGGNKVGVISNKSLLDESIELAILQLEQKYQTKVIMVNQDDIKLFPYKIFNSNKITSQFLVTYLREKMVYSLEFQELYVDEKSIGIIESDQILDDLLLELTYLKYKDKTADTKFTSNIRTSSKFASPDELMTLNELVHLATQTSPAYAEYKVQPGDTLSGIAYKLGITINKLANNNPTLNNNNTIVVGDVLQVQLDVPFIQIQKADENSLEELVTWQK
ncbi:MAG: hypothetical protein BEN19_00555 [Epulopiscium sp. Nuni2H_MBin003]|nr:MAG: hypothetical protein BEN19_00555 [Epulopiscium sp. Nuni2H_MBin003]